MKIRLLLVFAFFSTIGASAQGIYKQSLAGLATINFPAKPIATDTLGYEVFHYTDSIARYIVVAQDLSREPGFKLKAGELTEFYKGHIEGVLKTANGVLVSEKPFEIDGLKGIDLVYTSTNPNLPDLRFKRLIYLNLRVLSIDFWIKSENEQQTKVERDRFFNSFVITADQVNTLQETLPTSNDQAFNVGYVIGVVSVLAIVIGLIVVIVLFVKKRVAGKKV